MRLVVPIGASLAVVLAVGALSVGSRAATPGPEITAADAAAAGFEIVPESAKDAVAKDAISKDAANKMAFDAVPWVADKPATIVAGRASATVGSEVRAVWVVVVDGGRVPSWGPVSETGEGGKALEPRLTGMIVDQVTGEVLRCFLLTPHPGS